ncbi:MAG: hypothetical protein ACOC22_00135 [bacterium]
MANLKIDLLNKLKNDKYFEENELVRLAGDANMNYREKINIMSFGLEKIAIINSQIALVEQYFQDAPPPQQEQKQPVQTNVHQGQTHGE